MYKEAAQEVKDKDRSTKAKQILQYGKVMRRRKDGADDKNKGRTKTYQVIETMKIVDHSSDEDVMSMKEERQRRTAVQDRNNTIGQSSEKEKVTINVEDDIPPH